MAQRLVRKICSKCAEEHDPDITQLDALKLPHDYFAENKLVKGKGCAECKDGYKGRIGIFEIFMIDEATQQLIYEGVSASKIRRHARSIGMRTLREDGLRKVANGMTTLEEVVRVTASDEAEEFESA
jgi:type IV pilus assembly protein PilB